MAASSRFGLALCPLPRQKIGLAEAIAQAPGAPNALAAIRSGFASSAQEAIELDPDGGILTAVLEESAPIFDLIVAIQEAVWPLRLRAALVTAPPAGAAGATPAIRDKARKQLKRSNKRDALSFSWSTRSESEIGLAVAVAQLHSTLLSEWTAARASAVRSYRRLGRQAEVAKELGVSQQAVSQMLLGARFRELKAAEESMRSWLSGPKRTSLWPLRNLGTAPAGV